MCISLSFKRNHVICLLRIPTTLNEPAYPFQHIYYIEGNIQQLPHLGCVYPLMIDQFGSQTHVGFDKQDAEEVDGSEPLPYRNYRIYDYWRHFIYQTNF